MKRPFIVFEEEQAIKDLLDEHPNERSFILGMAEVMVFTGVWDQNDQPGMKKFILKEAPEGHFE
jgi:hypothetical protein